MASKRTRVWPELSLPLVAPVMDNHTHLPVHDGEIPKANGIKLSLTEQLNRAEAANVTHLISSACELPDFDPMLDIARAYPQVKVALALHPNDAALHAGHAEPSPDGMTPAAKAHHIPLDEALALVDKALADPNAIAVGETGLDYFRTAEPGRHAQKESFHAHLEMAERHGLPLQIHDREAHEDTIDVLNQHPTHSQPIIFHCYSGDAHMAKILAQKGWYASFAGPITYPANADLREALRTLPRELVLVETDAPYLTPAPHRGCPNASYVMAHTVRFIADLWKLSEEEACDQLMRNSQAVYSVW